MIRACTRCGQLPESCSCPRARQRPSSARQGYDRRWRRIRARYLRDHPVCEAPGCAAPATDVDHIDGTGPRGDNSDGNLQALCRSHHATKTNLHDGGGGHTRTVRR